MPSYLSPGVYVEEVEAGPRPIEGVGTAVAAFVGFTEKGQFNTPTLVTNWAQFTQNFGEFVAGYYLAHSVYGYFLNGGTACYIVRIGGAPTALPTGAQAEIGGYRVAAKQLPEGEITVEVTDQGEGTASDRFTVLVKRNGDVVETHNVTTRRTKDNVLTVIQEKSNLITVEEIASSAKLEKGTVVLRDLPPAAPVEVTADDFVGDVADRTGFGGLESIDEVTMVAVPDLMGQYQRGVIDLGAVKAVQLGIIAHCELMGDRMAILDPPPSLTPHQVKQWRTDGANYDSKYAALYYPWLDVLDQATGTTIAVPPSGHLAGVWARTDSTRGVHKAPANEVVRGAVALRTQLTKAEQELLNPAGVNCIRSFSGRGVRVWGARTLSSDKSWQYLNVRRLFNYLEESILDGTQWVVFEPNDDALWARVRRTIGAFLTNEWRKGALFGLTPDEAFYVKCDQETNPAESIDAGQVICEVGIAPVKPAEFVIFKLAQISGGTSLVNE